MHREIGLYTALFELSDIPTGELDPGMYAGLLTGHSVRLLDVDAAGLLLLGEDGTLHEHGATSDTVRRLQLLQLQLNSGPGLDTVRTASPVSAADLHSDTRWARFRTATLDSGFAAVHSTPLRVHAETLGSLNLYRNRVGGPTDDEWAQAELLTHVATTYLLLNRAIRTSETLSRQLQSALHSRVAIEQAKGILAGRRGSTLAGALDVMRTFARHYHRRLDEVAHAVIDGSPSVSTLSTCGRNAPHHRRNSARRTG
jgi:GAF domain-containing protein